MEQAVAARVRREVPDSLGEVDHAAAPVESSNSVVFTLSNVPARQVGLAAPRAFLM